MAIDYVDLVGEYFPDTECYSSGDPSDYNAVVWTSAAIPQASLDTVYLVQLKTNKILEFSEYARTEITSGFLSSALGFPHLYDAEPEDQLNLIGAAATEGDVVYSSWPTSNGTQIVNCGGIVTGVSPTGYLNNATQYLAEIQVDGVSTYLAFDGQDVQTYNDLITQINLDADFSPLGIATLVDGTIKIESKSYNASSTINIVDATLFNSLTDYVAINAAVAGTDVKILPKEYKNHTHADLLVVLNDGKNVKLTILQKFAVKKAQIEAAADETALNAIVWE